MAGLRSLLLCDHEAIRRAWVLQKLDALAPGLKLLDAGCGAQPFRDACSRLDYSSQDFGQYKPEASQPGLHPEVYEYGKLDYVCDIWRIPVDDATFDAVLCTEVLEHVPYPRETLKELARILAPGGTLILTAPYACLPHFAPHFYFSGFHPNFYRHALAEYGLRVTELRPCGNDFYFVSQELLRLRKLIKSRAARFLFAPLAGALVMILKNLGDNAQQEPMLPLGYFVLAQKPVGEAA